MFLLWMGSMKKPILADRFDGFLMQLV